MVRIGPGVDPIELREALLIFLPRWPFREREKIKRATMEERRRLHRQAMAA